MGDKDKSRTWATIVYENDDNWIQKLEDLKIGCYVICHDKDTNDDGSLVKKHWHVLLLFQGQKNRANILEIVKQFGGVGGELVHSRESYLFYLCHLKSRDKHVYDVSEVISLNGVENYADVVKNEIKDRYTLLNEMIEWISDNHIYYFADLVDYSRMEKHDWFKILADKNSHLIWEYIKSKTWKNGKHTI